ncbi:hypothetical protein LCGC14_2806380 [marine sediment metagenome]|uniref:Uncharacterized protein n=1 Tax=marine sediment metagenome TaxID=412755 RepID=A0A0F8YL72_9ZZZZ
MKEGERDELLIRLDERTKQTLELTHQQETHLNKLNSSIQQHAIDIAVLKDRKTSKKAISGYSAAIFGLLVALWKSFTGS